ncbi:hypothetical protein SteCoe_10704 [Stentor coeruleus]|uniref:rRNA biogenesis protein RRP36 n=1 Tax=Stentor coeruleus TaxID=5963 RepID=A0A1R2CF06_9CILI|nr:hypothetical protein SteCoe_10704 [Stentor coeruleus]
MEEVPFKKQLAKDRKKSEVKAVDTTFKRASKHAPKEMSSKMPASKIKPIKFYRSDEDPESGKFVKKFKPKDPRFENYAGNFNQGLFEASYSFMDDYRSNELSELEKSLHDTAYSDQYDSLKKVYMKKKQEIQRFEDQNRENKLKRKFKKEEKEKVQKGKKPFFLKKGLIKMMAMKEKMEDLKVQGKYEDYIRKKRKREKTMQRSEAFALPSERRT